MSDSSENRAASAKGSARTGAPHGPLSKKEIRTTMQRHAAYLAGTDPQGRANFIGCTLSGYVFPKKESLARVQFQHAVIDGCILAGNNDLAGADFSGAEIRNSSLAGAVNLKEARFGTAQFSEVTFPANYAPDELTRSIREHGPRIEKLFYTLLVTCTTAGILAWISPDEQVFRQTGIITLPFLSFGVPIGTFFALTPWLLFIFHVYFLTALLRFWRDLRNAPTAVASDRPVYHDFPIFPNFAIPLKLWGTYNRRVTDNPGGPIRRLISTCFDLFYLGVAPIAQAVIWARYLPAQTLASSVSQSTAISFSIAAIGYAVLRGNAQHRQGLRVERLVSQEAPSPTDPVEHATTRARTIGHRIRRVRDVSVKIFKGQAASFVIDTKTGKRTYVGQREDLRLWEEMKQSQNRGYRIDERRLVVNHRPILWIAFIALGVLTFLSSGIKSTTGCGLDNLPRYSGDHNVCYDLAADLRGVVLTGATLNDRSFRRAFLPEVKLSGANLEHSDFTAAYLGDADLSSTRMKHATLSNAVMWEAKLPGADLREAVFDGADLRGANLAGARLQGANLSSADLRGADLTGAVVCGAKLPGRDRYSFTARDKIFGIEFVDGPAPKMMISAPKGPRPVGGQKGYLRGHDAAEYPKWERAYTQVQEALLELTNRPTPTALRAMGAALGRIDVSNGQSTQRAQMLAIESLQAAASGRTVAGALAHDDLQDFLEEVEKKARDHCISTHGALAAPNIPSPVWAYNLQRLRRLVIDHLYPL